VSLLVDTGQFYGGSFVSDYVFDETLLSFDDDFDWIVDRLDPAELG